MKWQTLTFSVLGFPIILRPCADLVEVEARGSVVPGDVARRLLAKGGVNNNRELAIPLCSKHKKMEKVNKGDNAFNDK